MKCPYCAHPETKVTDSREADDGIRRRRECLNCGRRFTTYERVQAALFVVKKDGRREEYSRDKLRVGITRSCAKLPVTGAQIEALLDDIEVALHAMGATEIPSTEVGDLVMERLRELNYAAYVRFAAHYRDFLSVDDLQEEIIRRRVPRRRDAAQPPLLPPTPLDAPAPPSRIAAGRARRTHR